MARGLTGIWAYQKDYVCFVGVFSLPFPWYPLRNILIHILLSSPLFIHCCIRWITTDVKYPWEKSYRTITSHCPAWLRLNVASFRTSGWWRSAWKQGWFRKFLQPWGALSLLHTWFHDASHVFIYFVLMYPTTPPPTARLREYSDHVPPDFHQLRVICGASRFMAKIFSHGTSHPPTQREVTRSKILPSYPTWAQRWLKSFRRHFSSPSLWRNSCPRVPVLIALCSFILYRDVQKVQ